MSPFRWLLIHHGSGLYGGGARDGLHENGVWVIYVSVVVANSLTEYSCSLENGS